MGHLTCRLIAGCDKNIEVVIYWRDGYKLTFKWIHCWYIATDIYMQQISVCVLNSVQRNTGYIDG